MFVPAAVAMIRSCNFNGLENRLFVFRHHFESICRWQQIVCFLTTKFPTKSMKIHSAQWMPMGNKNARMLAHSLNENWSQSRDEGLAVRVVSHSILVDCWPFVGPSKNAATRISHSTHSAALLPFVKIQNWNRTESGLLLSLPHCHHPTPNFHIKHCALPNIH